MMEGIYSKDGMVYTIPRPPSNGVAGYAYMYYNKDVIEAAGLTDKIPTTWAEFEAACAALKAIDKYCSLRCDERSSRTGPAHQPLHGGGYERL